MIENNTQIPAIRSPVSLGMARGRHPELETLEKKLTKRGGEDE